MHSSPCLSSYYFRKIPSKIHALCFFINPLTQGNIREQIMFHLVKSLFFSSQDYKNKYINYTQTKKEFSMFLDKNSLDKFLRGLSKEVADLINIDDESYRVFEIFTNENDLHTPGVTALIASKFAEKDIPIIYSNSFNNSFILVTEKYYNKSVNILKCLANPEDDKDDE